MMPNITTGGNTQGLIRYLLGPGRANEHTHQHIIGASPEIKLAWSASLQQSASSAPELARQLDRNLAAGGEGPRGERSEWSYETERMESLGKGPNHVLHVSLSLKAEEGELTDEKWEAIAQDFVAEMGIATGDPQMDCQWVAIRHGLSEGGNDHIHIVANRVRGDGTAWSEWQSKRRSQRVATILEQRHGLTVLESRVQGRGAVHDSMEENSLARRTGAAETYRATLERKARAAATAATSEVEFIELVRSQGFRIRPFFAKGRTDVITGYSVGALDKDLPEGIKTPWRAGSKLAKDLGLPALRTRWEDTPTSAMEAAAAWQDVWHSGAQEWKQRPATEGELQARAGAAKVFSEQLAKIDPHDPVQLANASADIAGALHALADNPDAGRAAWELRRLARQVAHGAQINQRPATKQPRLVASAIAARVLLTAAAGHSQAARTAILITSMIELVGELAALYKAGQQANTAAHLETRAAQALKDAQRALEHNPWLDPPLADTKEEAMQAQDQHALDTLNPTGSVFETYDPTQRATATIGEHLAPLSTTQDLPADEMVTIYRGVPADSAHQINPGDFITTNRQLAADYAGAGIVLQAEVPASQILDDQREPGGEEYIYRPDLTAAAPEPQREHNPWLDPPLDEPVTHDAAEEVPVPTEVGRLVGETNTEEAIYWRANAPMSERLVRFSDLREDHGQIRLTPVYTEAPTKADQRVLPGQVVYATNRALKEAGVPPENIYKVSVKDTEIWYHQDAALENLAKEPMLYRPKPEPNSYQDGVDDYAAFDVRQAREAKAQAEWEARQAEAALRPRQPVATLSSDDWLYQKPPQAPQQQRGMTL